MLSAVFVLTASFAHAVEPSLVLARVDEVQALRALRLDAKAPAVPRSVYTEAAGGAVVTGLEQVEGHKAKQAWGVAIVDVPIARYWAAINDDASKVDYTRLDYAEILRGTACGSPRRVFQFLPVPLLTDRWWVIDIRANDALRTRSNGRVREQVWATDGDFATPTPTATAWAAKGMHIDFTRGAWLLIDLDGTSTLVEYYTWADPGGSVPAGLASSMAAGGIDDTIQSIATLATKGTRCPVD
ncbi:MAG: hypothetical protein H6733_03035 [Alphaproteobacteria bacterium]|nr:hypothetical protein [Alphaproteobacteria bacterium]